MPVFSAQAEAPGQARTQEPARTPEAARPAANSPILFNAVERSARGDALFQQICARLWADILEKQRNQPAFDSEGSRLRPADAKQWRNLVERAKNADELAVLRMVNGYFNQWRSISDDKAWETPEYWASPAEFMQKRGGDCEDYAIAKYFALRFLGTPAKHMRLAIVRPVSAQGIPAGQLHMVLAVFARNNWFILDNNVRPRDNIIMHTQYGQRMVPLYSFNENDAWAHEKDPAANSAP